MLERNALACVLLGLLATAPALAADDPDLPPGAPAALKDEVRRTYRVLLDGQRAYLASTVGVVTADLTDPTRPRYLGALALPDSVNDLALVGGRLAIAGGPGGIVLAEPGPRPRRLGGLVLAGAAMGVAGTGKLLLVASGSNGLHLIEVSDPAHPRRLDHWETSGYAREVRQQGDLIALADGAAGVHLFRISQNRLQHISTVAPRGKEPHVFALAFAGKLLLAASGAAGLLVIDLARPEQPRVLAQLAVRDAARGVAAQGGRAAIADGTAGVALIDLQDPTAPKETGRYRTERSANRLLLRGDLIYVANDYDGLLILRAPTAAGDPTLVGRLPAPAPKR